MKLNELMDVMNGNQFVDIYYKDKWDNPVKCASRNLNESVDEKYLEAEVISLTVTKYQTFDVIIEKVATNKRYSVTFSMPDWIDLCEEQTFEFEDDESEDEINDYIKDAFSEWVDAKLDELRDYAEDEINEVEEY